MEADFEKSKKTALTVLKENYITTPPVPVLTLAKNYGYDVKAINISPDIAGFIKIDEKIIYINSADSANRQAFTIAHELGHILLHGHLLNDLPEIGIIYRKPLGKPNSDTSEQEANCFAANLLVPDSFLTDYKSKYAEKMLTDNVIANIFGVSAEVIRYRLQDLAKYDNSDFTEE